MINYHEFLINTLTVVIEGMESTIPGNVEVVLHDFTLGDKSVLKILNGHISGRATGAELLSAPDQDMGFLFLDSETVPERGTKIVDNYISVTSDGRRLNSSSTIFFYDGKATAALCLNVDNSGLFRIKQEILALEGANKKNVDNKADEHLTSIEKRIDDILIRFYDSGALYKKPTRLKIVKNLNESGIFKIKGALNMAAKKIGVSKYTIYNDINHINKGKLQTKIT